MKILANENFPLPAILFLRNLDYDITSIADGYSGVSDEYVMSISDEEQRVIITFDRDYGELIFKHNYKPLKGVILLRLEHYEPHEPGVVVDRLFREYKIDTERALTVFDGRIVRQRKY